MSPSVKASDKISPRKTPSQERAQARVNTILQATCELLATEGINALTTNHIAKDSGMAIGSLYRYFPNKQAIIYELYQRWLKATIADLEQFLKQASEAECTHEEYFSDLLDNLYMYPSGDEGKKAAKIEIELRKAMKLYPELGEMDYLHGIRIGKMFSDILRQRGIKAPAKVIKQLGYYIYAMDGTVELLQQQGDQSMKHILEWQKRALLGVLAPYFS